MRDRSGRTLYLVDLRDKAFDSIGGDAPSAQDRQRFAAHHPPKAIAAVAALEKTFGITHNRMMSSVSNSFSAYMTAEQLSSVRDYPLVTEVTEVTKIKTSAGGPPWADSQVQVLPNPDTERHSWGRFAVNGRVVDPTKAPRVYVIDGGVAFHKDLFDVSRVNLSPGIPVVGCYPHATHVAGIIGAKFGNKGIAGAAAGAKLISVAVATLGYPTIDPQCGDTQTLDALAEAIDWVRVDAYVNSPDRAVVANISMNGFSYSTTTIRLKIASLASPLGSYKGSFVAQSAGNDSGSACDVSYGPVSTSDGVMVVGAFKSTAQIASWGVDLSNPWIYPGGSNYGACVEAYAPGEGILSTWGNTTWPLDPSQALYRTNNNYEYDTYLHLSGTSMAAPHVAAIAALFMSRNPGLTPSQVEQLIRKHLYPGPYNDPDGGGMWLARFRDLAATTIIDAALSD